MSKCPPLDECKTHLHFEKYLAPIAEKIGQCGSHVKYRAPNGAQIIFTNHPGDIPTGTRKSIIKMIKLAGLGIVLFPCAVVAIIANWPTLGG